MKIKFIITLLFYFSLNCYAETNVFDDPANLYQVPDNEVLSSKITVKRSLNNINDLINILNLSALVKTRVIKYTGEKIPAIKIFLDNVNLRELIENSSNRLGYKWKLEDKTVIFDAIVPIVDITHVPKFKKENLDQWVLEQKDRTLRIALTKWCAKAGWHLIWRVGADYPIVVPWTIHSSFESAINEILLSSQNTEMPIQAVMHDNNKVIEIYDLATGT